MTEVFGGESPVEDRISSLLDIRARLAALARAIPQSFTEREHVASGDHIAAAVAGGSAAVPGEGRRRRRARSIAASGTTAAAVTNGVMQAL